MWIIFRENVEVGEQELVCSFWCLGLTSAAGFWVLMWGCFVYVAPVEGVDDLLAVLVGGLLQ